MDHSNPHASPPAADTHEPASRPSSPKRRRTGPSPTSADLTLESAANADSEAIAHADTQPADAQVESSASDSPSPQPKPQPQPQPLRVLEFYSGIGGMHYALKNAGIDAQIVAAFEVFDVANSVYKHNFGKGIVKQGLLEAHKPSDFEKYNADLWTMSPPCQPYTRQLSANQLGASDPRSKSFLYLLHVLRTLPTHARPRFVLVENVKGFDESVARDLLVRTLNELGYSTAEMLLNPIQFGVPNSRLRYYLVARREGGFKSSEVTAAEFPEVKAADADEEGANEEAGEGKGKGKKKMDTGSVRTEATPGNILEHIPGDPDVPLDHVRPLSEYLEPTKDEPQAWKDAVVWKRTPLFDIVTPSSRRSCCFTKNYTTYFEGTGSVLQESDHLDVKAIWPDFLARQPAALAQIERKEPVTDVENPLLPLRLRFFSPREVANLMCFPAEFAFPKGITEKQKYRLLGNSINVRVVGKVMRFMLDIER